jgi:hypothetical protein
MKSDSDTRGGARAGACKPPFQPTETDRSMVSVLAAVSRIVISHLWRNGNNILEFRHLAC